MFSQSVLGLLGDSQSQDTKTPNGKQQSSEQNNRVVQLIKYAQVHNINNHGTRSSVPGRTYRIQTLLGIRINARCADRVIAKLADPENGE